jgi:hypothetical protein
MTLYQRHAHTVHVLLLVCITTLVFINCLDSYFFIADDFSTLTRGQTGDVLTLLTRNWIGGEGGGNYRPLEPISHVLELRLFGPDNPLVRRITSLVAHLLNVILLYALVWQLAKRKLVALTAALIFAVHPLHAQALPPVAWISGRTDLFVTFFYLVAFLLFIRGVTRKSFVLMGLSLCSFALALLAKEMAVTLPVMLLAYCVLVRPDAQSPWLGSGRGGLPRKSLISVGVLGLLAALFLGPACGALSGGSWRLLRRASTGFGRAGRNSSDGGQKRRARVAPRSLHARCVRARGGDLADGAGLQPRCARVSG